MAANSKAAKAGPSAIGAMLRSSMPLASLVVPTADVVNPGSSKVGNVPDDIPDEDALEEIEVDERDEYKRILESQGLFKRLLGHKPQYRTICFHVTAVQSYGVTMDMLKQWGMYGLVILQEDRKGMVIRCRAPPLISAGTKEAEFVFEIRSSNGNRRTSASILRVTMEKGNTTTFEAFYKQIHKVYTSQAPNMVMTNDLIIRRMNKIFFNDP
ncbi:hypothetical protein FN846DRAFT_164344 [Sphaerosporella brunnea]|uniref:non-specific serine/threonine protein kinase n=1 Tax=Sphaerosporella brunnea TaxID=1250544 RepID=A0A5J5EPP2_9PEZI|nr:hypothetical protein FN846DRAFT_164344 [Sphaerosporella brunnea]